MPKLHSQQDRQFSIWTCWEVSMKPEMIRLQTHWQMKTQVPAIASQKIQSEFMKLTFMRKNSQIHVIGVNKLKCLSTMSYYGLDLNSNFRGIGQAELDGTSPACPEPHVGTNSLRHKAWTLCKNYLQGIWTHTSPQDIQIKPIR